MCWRVAACFATAAAHPSSQKPREFTPMPLEKSMYVFPSPPMQVAFLPLAASNGNRP